MKVTNIIELDALFRLMYFRGLLGVNIQLIDRLFLQDSHFIFSSNMSKNYFQFLRGHLCFENKVETPEL